jgi:HK97 family phage major capsid protein
MTPDNPFALESRDNPNGFRTREVTVYAERAGEGDDAPLSLAISSEAAVPRYDWRTGEEYDEVLDHGPNGVDLSYVADGLPFLLDHELEDQIGLGTAPTLSADRVLRTEVRRGNHPDAAWVFADMAAGIRKKVSIGYWPGEKYTQSKDERTGRITRRYVGWMLYEASSVAVPADYAVGVGRSASGAARTEQAGTPALSTESKMSVETTSERGMAPAPDTRAQELATLARNFPTHARLAEWIGENVTVDAARDEVMRKLAAAADQRATISSTPAVEVGVERETQKPWNSFTEFMRSVVQANTGRVDARLNGARAATGMGIGSDPDGGFMVPEQYAQGVITRAFDGGNILSRTRRIPVSGNQYHMSLVDENSRANGSRWGGIQSYRMGEGTAVTPSKPKIRRATLDVTKKIGVACYVTEEQLQDATATDTILTQAMSEEVMVRTEGEIWAGLGGAECLGIMTSGALVTVTKVNAQAADTVVAGNVSKMNARLWAGSHQTAGWFINQQVLEQLPLMTIGDTPVYVPPTGLAGSSPFGTLLGKPIFVVEHASALGDVGDIVLADFSQYALGEKAMSQVARSMHVKFLEGEEVFRLIYRVDGLPLWNAPLTLKDGTTTVSPFVTVEAR